MRLRRVGLQRQVDSQILILLGVSSHHWYSRFCVRTFQIFSFPLSPLFFILLFFTLWRRLRRYMWLPRGQCGALRPLSLSSRIRLHMRLCSRGRMKRRGGRRSRCRGVSSPSCRGMRGCGTGSRGERGDDTPASGLFSESGCHLHVERVIVRVGGRCCVARGAVVREGVVELEKEVLSETVVGGEAIVR